jgi:hypothetical protein
MLLTPMLLASRLEIRRRLVGSPVNKRRYLSPTSREYVAAFISPKATPSNKGKSHPTKV